MNKIATLLLLIGGAVHAFPQLDLYLSDISGGTPIIQIGVGILSVLIGLTLFKNTEAPVSV